MRVPTRKGQEINTAMVEGRPAQEGGEIRSVAVVQVVGVEENVGEARKGVLLPLTIGIDIAPALPQKFFHCTITVKYPSISKVCRFSMKLPFGVNGFLETGV